MGIIDEPEITRDEILVLEDERFNPENVCVVTGAASGIGRATAIVAAVNGLTVVGLDIDEARGSETAEMAKELGGRVVFVKTDLTRDEDLERAIEEAAGLGRIRFLAISLGFSISTLWRIFPWRSMT